MSRPTIESHEGVWPEIPNSCFVHQSAVIIGRVTLGERVSIWPNTTLRGDEGTISIGDDCNIQDGTVVHMTGGESDTVLGSRITVGHNCILHGCIIADDVLIGMGSLVMDNVEIGAGSYIGAGTLIPPRKVIPPNSLVYGNPFRIVRETNEKQREWIQYAWKHYWENAEKYRAKAGA